MSETLTKLLSAVEPTSPPLYPDNPNFGRNLILELKKYKGPGAGVDIDISPVSGDAVYPMEVFNWLGTQVNLPCSKVPCHYPRVKVAHWNQGMGVKWLSASPSVPLPSRRSANGSNTSGVSAWDCQRCVWKLPDQLPPVQPSVQKCAAGEMNLDDFECDPCRMGYHTSESSLYSCLPCAFGGYAHQNKSNDCQPCATGSTTWAKGSSDSSACRCTEGYYTPLAYSATPRFESLGCFSNAPPLFVGSSNAMTLGECNWKCFSHFEEQVTRSGLHEDQGPGQGVITSGPGEQSDQGYRIWLKGVPDEG